MVSQERNGSDRSLFALLARWWSSFRPSRAFRKDPTARVYRASPGVAGGPAETTTAAAITLVSPALGEDGNRTDGVDGNAGTVPDAPAGEEDMLAARETEVRDLERQVQELSVQLSNARERLDVLATYQEAVRNLREKNSLLAAKTAQQARWLKSLSVGNPKNEELRASLKRTSDENRRLRAELLRDFELFGRVKDHLPAAVRPTTEELTKRKQQLFASLENKDEALRNAVDPSKLSLADHTEILTEQNQQLRSMMGSKQSLEGLLKSPEQASTPEATSRVISALKRENQRLEKALREKEAQVNSIPAPPETRQLLTAYTDLQERYHEIFCENQNRDQLSRLQQQDKLSLAAQTRERTTLIRENQKLKSELVSTVRMIKELKTRETRFRTLQKEHAQLAAEHVRVKAELGVTTERLKQVTTEYHMVIDKYERLFESR